MPDDVQGLITRVTRELASVRWPGAEEIRLRARRRRFRRALAAPCATLLVLGLVFLGPGRPNSVTGQVAIPPEVLLQPGDLGPTYRVVDRGVETRSIGITVAVSCWTRVDVSFPAEGITALSSRARELTVVDEPVDGTVSQRVDRFAGGASQVVVGQVYQIATRCERFILPVADGLEAVHTFDTVRTGFAGDDSVLIREVVRTTYPGSSKAALSDRYRLHAVVRVADLVTVVSVPVNSPDRLQELSQLAARRLCRATRC